RGRGPRARGRRRLHDGGRGRPPRRSGGGDRVGALTPRADRFQIRKRTRRRRDTEHTEPHRGRDSRCVLGELCVSVASVGPLAVAGLVLLSGRAPAAEEAPRYDFRPGDRLVYRQQIERPIESPQVRPSTRGEWTNVGLVVAERAGGFRVGFQRTRIRAELLEYREDGRDRLARERPAFDERMGKRPAAFSEGNWLLPSGAAQLPWAA